MKLGTIRGIVIKLHFSTLLIVGLVGFSAATFFLSQVPNASLTDIIIVGILNGFIILVSILIHELFQISSISLFSALDPLHPFTVLYKDKKTKKKD